MLYRTHRNLGQLIQGLGRCRPHASSGQRPQPRGSGGHRPKRPPEKAATGRRRPPEARLTEPLAACVTRSAAAARGHRRTAHGATGRLGHAASRCVTRPAARRHGVRGQQPAPRGRARLRRPAAARQRRSGRRRARRARAARPGRPTARTAQTARRPLTSVARGAGAPGGPSCSSRPTSFRYERSPAGSWSRRPWPRIASICTVHEPIPGIVRSRRQPRSCSAGSSASRSTRPDATSRAARRSATARPSVRSNDASSAGAWAAIVAAAGLSRRPLTGSCRPSRAIRRRWIVAARSYSISCSQTANDSASNGSGRAGWTQPRVGPDRRADQRIEPEPLVKRAQIKIDPERPTHPRDPPPGQLLGARLGAEQDPVGRQLHGPDHDRLAGEVDQPVQDLAAPAAPAGPFRAGAASQTATAV